MSTEQGQKAEEEEEKEKIDEARIQITVNQTQSGHEQTRYATENRGNFGPIPLPHSREPVPVITLFIHWPRVARVLQRKGPPDPTSIDRCHGTHP